MGYTEVSCPSCGQHSSVDTEVARRMTTCPACGAPLPPPAMAAMDGKTAVAAPSPTAQPRWRLKIGEKVGAPSAASAEASSAGEPRLRLNPAGAVGGELRICPSCGIVMGPQDVVCTACGFNTSTGRYVQVEHARRERLRRALATLTIILILGGLSATAWRRGWIRLPDSRSWFTPATPPPAAEAETAVPPARTEEEIALWASALENAVRARLDTQSPMFERGQEVEIEMLDGRVIAGIFRGLKQGRIALIEVEGVLREVPNDRLRPISRVRVDAAYREEWIRAEARRRAESGLVE